MVSLSDLRRDYPGGELRKSDLRSNPLEQFQEWFEAALATDQPDPNAMVLATVDEKGMPSVRTVLLKSAGAEGFTFFTNYESRKGRELAQNPQAALVFYWSPSSRQVRIQGRVKKIPRGQSQEYFDSRPRRSRLAAFVSPQSRRLESREDLERLFRRADREFEGKEVPLPDFWGGYRLVPERFEFWQGRPDRLHDRFEYRLQDDVWRIDRLAP